MRDKVKIINKDTGEVIKENEGLCPGNKITKNYEKVMVIIK